MYNLLEYSKNYRKTIGSLYNYYRVELNGDADNNNFANNNVVSSSAFNYKNKIIGNIYNVNSTNAGPFADDPRVFNPNYDAERSGKKKCRTSHIIKILR